MPPPEDERPLAAVPAAAAVATAALIETTLHRARILVLHPTRVVIVGDGLRLRIDHSGVTRQALTDLRLVLPLPAEASADAPLQETLARWAGQATELHVHELVRSGEGFARSLHLTDATGVRTTLDQVSGRAAA